MIDKIEIIDTTYRFLGGGRIEGSITLSIDSYYKHREELEASLKHSKISYTVNAMEYEIYDMTKFDTLKTEHAFKIVFEGKYRNI